MSPISRRTLLTGGAALAASAAAPTLLFGRRSPNDTIRIAVVGLRGRGRSHLRAFSKSPGVEIVALCDVDRRVLDKAASGLLEAGTKVATFVDYRELLEQKDIDAVSIATPNHWHALQTIWACQAGKDVYVEKPVSHNIWEGRQAVKAAEKYGRIVQAGTQIRSSPSIQQAFEWIARGELGGIELARGLCYKPRQSIGKVSAPTEVDPSVDYDLWTGPAPMKPLGREKLHYDWHWVFDTGNGDLGNQGIHQVDLCRWALGESGLAEKVVSVGGRFGYVDDGNTPNTQIMIHQYEKATLLFEVRGLPRDKQAQTDGWKDGMDDYMGSRIGVVVHCEHGTLRVPSYTEAHAHDLDGNHILSWKGGGDQLHYDNFVEAVRSRKSADQAGPIEEGHISSALCHAGNASYLAGDTGSRRDGEKRLTDVPFAGEAFDRMCSHLERNGVDVDRSGLRIGRVLEIDSENEVFRDPSYSSLLRRDYRAPFVVPQEV